MNASMLALNAAAERNSARLAALQGKMLGAVATGYALAKSLSAPIRAGAQFETMLEDIRQKAPMSAEALAAIGTQLRQIAVATDQLPTDTVKTFDALLGLGLGGATDAENITAALKMLPAINKVATAYRAAAEDVMRAGQAAFANLKVPAEDLIKAFDAMAQSGKDGAFELKDMATYFPELTSMAQTLGMKGVKSVADLAAALQVVRQGAGDASKAATNLRDLLAKLNAPVTQSAFKKFSIDFRKELEAATKKGMSPIEAAVAITQKALKKGAKIGDLFQNQEAQLAMLALLADMERYRKVRAAAIEASGVVEADFAERIKTADAATTRFKGSLENLNISVSKGLLPTFTSLIDKVLTPFSDAMGKFAESNPLITKWVVGTTAGLIGLRIAGFAAKFGLSWMWGGGLMVARGALLALGVAGGPLSIVLGAIGAAAVYAYTHWDEVRALWERLKQPWRNLRSEIEKTRQAMAGPWSRLPEKMGSTGAQVAGPWSNLGAELSSTWDMITGKFSGLGAKLAETWKMISEPMVAAIGELAGKIKSGASALYDAGVTLVVQLWEGMKAKVQELLGWAAGIASRIRGAFSGAASAAGSGGGAPAVAGARAAGGPVSAGKSYLVGERGPELFRPTGSGEIVDTLSTLRAMHGAAGSRSGGGRAGGVVNHNSFSISVQGSPGQSAEQLAEIVLQKLSSKLNALSNGAYSDGVYVGC